MQTKSSVFCLFFFFLCRISVLSYIPLFHTHTLHPLGAIKRYNRLPENQAASFRDAMAFIAANASAPCWVSTACYWAPAFVAGWVEPQVAAQPNLRVFYRTVVTATTVQAGRVTSVLAVQRTALPSVDESALLMSTMLADWFVPVREQALFFFFFLLLTCVRSCRPRYSADPSKLFNKTRIEFQGSVFIEATEYAILINLFLRKHDPTGR